MRHWIEVCHIFNYAASTLVNNPEHKPSCSPSFCFLDFSDPLHEIFGGVMNGQMELCARKVKVWSTGRRGLMFGGGVKRGPRWGKLNVCHGSRAHVHVCPVLAPERLLMCCRCVCHSRPSSRPILRGQRMTKLRWPWWPCHRRSVPGLLRSGWGLSHCLAAARGSEEHSDKSDMKGGGRDAWGPHTHTHTHYSSTTQRFMRDTVESQEDRVKREIDLDVLMQEKNHTLTCV